MNVAEEFLDAELREEIQVALAKWLGRCAERGVKMRVAQEVAAATLAQMGRNLGVSSIFGGASDSRDVTAGERIREVIQINNIRRGHLGEKK